MEVLLACWGWENILRVLNKASALPFQDHPTVLRR